MSFPDTLTELVGRIIAEEKEKLAATCYYSFIRWVGGRVIETAGPSYLRVWAEYLRLFGNLFRITEVK